MDSNCIIWLLALSVEISEQNLNGFKIDRKRKKGILFFMIQSNNEIIGLWGEGVGNDEDDG